MSNRNESFDLLLKPSLLFIKLPNTLTKTRLLPKTKPSAEGLIFCRRCSFLPKFQFSSCPCCSQKICCPSQILSNEFRLFGFFWMLNVRFRPKLENPVSVNHYTTCYLSHSTFNRAISPSWHYTLETVYSCHFYVPFMWHFTTIQY